MSANFTHPDFFAKRPGESQLAYEMRIRPYLHHREDAQADADQAHAEFRALQETRTSGTGYGLVGDMTPQQRATAAGTRGFGGDQQVELRGHLGVTAVPGSRAIQRIYASQLTDGEPAVSPLATHLRSSGESWH
jgi:hypothetical protein